MSREAHVRFSESLRVKPPGATRPDQERHGFRKNGVTRFGQKRQPFRRKAPPVSGKGGGRFG